MKQSNDPQKMSQLFSVPYKDNLGEAFHIQDLATSISEQRQSIHEGKQFPQMLRLFQLWYI